jgi:uncharacterized GH25 family protein
MREGVRGWAGFGIGARLARAVVFCCAAACAVATTARAQEVRGTARAAGVGVASPETTVALVDTAGHIVTVALADANGRYVLRAPRDGRYRVRARRIGFSPDSSALIAIRSDRPVTFDPVLTPFAARLTTVQVAKERRCRRIGPDAGATVMRLWTEVQSALTAVTVPAAPSVRFTLVGTTRELDASGKITRAAQSWTTHASSSELYRSIAAESLAIHGFVVPEGQDLVYYAPDAGTLLADAFAQTHCFRPTDDVARPELIGLAFAPAARRAEGERDVTGTLWLDRTSGELRYLEFTYDDPQHVVGSDPATASGRVDYARLPTGAWIVQRWRLRMPVLVTDVVSTASSGTTLGRGAILSRERVMRVTSVIESGGEVAGSGEVASSGAFGVVSGRFVERGAGASRSGVAGIHVELAPIGNPLATATRFRAETDSSGAFEFAGVTAGTYVLRASAPRLDTLGVRIAERQVTVGADTHQSALTELPTLQETVTRFCPEGLHSDEGVVHGVVRSRAGVPVHRARVRAEWFDIHDTRTAHFSVGTQSRVGITDSAGTYIICGVPRQHAINVTASIGAKRSDITHLPNDERVVRRSDPVIDVEARGTVTPERNASERPE